MSSLVHDASAGDTDAWFADVYRSYLPRVRALVARRVADPGLVHDLVQDSFVRAYRGRASFDPSRPVWPWLAAIASNTCANAARGNARARSDELSEAAAVADLRADPHEGLRAAEQRHGIIQALGELSDRQRKVLVATEVQGISVEHLARAQDVSPTSVRAVLKRARAQFRRAYLSLAEERGLLGGVPLVGRAVAGVRSARAKVGRLAQPASRACVRVVGAPISEAFAVALLGGALLTSGSGLHPSTAAASFRAQVAPAGVQVQATSASLGVGASAAATRPSKPTEAVANLRPLAHPTRPTAIARADHGQDGWHGWMVVSVDLRGLGGVDGGRTDYSCDVSIVSRTLCAEIARLPKDVNV